MDASVDVVVDAAVVVVSVVSDALTGPEAAIRAATVSAAAEPSEAKRIFLTV